MFFAKNVCCLPTSYVYALLPFVLKFVFIFHILLHLSPITFKILLLLATYSLVFKIKVLVTQDLYSQILISPLCHSIPKQVFVSFPLQAVEFIPAFYLRQSLQFLRVFYLRCALI